jgi:sugar phosphate isomerase/epimerase
MKLSQLAAQLYTVRDFCRDAGALAATARKIRTIGYPAVQLSGLGPIPDEEVVRIMADAGLTICATHEPSEQILAEPEKAADHVEQLGCRLTAYAWPAGIDFAQPTHIEGLVEQLERAGEVFHRRDLVLGYHNHAIEFVRHRGATVLEYIFERTSPQHVAAELDTYWIQYGGGDVVAWIEKMKGRLPFLHLKDYGFTTQNQPRFAEIGAGNLDWKKIIPAAEAAGCAWFIVEQDTCPGDPFESLRQSFDFIREHLINS